MTTAPNSIDVKTIDELVTLKHAASAARDTLNEAIKATAEKTGLKKSAIRRYVGAVAMDKVGELDEELKALETLIVRG